MAIEYQVEVQPIALQDMREAVRYIAEDLGSPSAALNLVDNLADAMDSLARLPSRCPLYVTSRSLGHEYRWLRVDNYLIFFWISEADELVTVSRVLYGRRDLERALDGR